ncbi:hypothetical protein [Sphingobacterium deserti]|uniref:Uncharacterized protein n=1 Tax=Sphingobacterium deserti TaxID=1229276 RepID=A0A0B8T1C2_9SPHI|nr:hypothetical protein [Sphingobacterium deserti]KGE14642.1 hypothetical protein DI53_1671 [Sphingobacterium deserti]
MELKEFLEANPILVRKELAVKMYPNLSADVARNKLTNKIKQYVIGSGTQRILPHDVEAAKKALTELRDNINEFLRE